MRSLLLSLLFSSACIGASAQAFPGLSGNDRNVLQVRFNPAFTVNEDRAQINFLSLGSEVGGNSVLFKKSIFGFIMDGDAVMDKDYSRNKNDQPSRNFWGNIELMGPQVSFRYKKRYFFSVGWGMRYLANSDNLDRQVYNLLGNHGTHSEDVTNYSVNNYSLTGQVFGELNLSYAGFLYQQEDYNLIGGATLKILDGFSAAGMGIKNGSFKITNDDGVARDVSGNVNVAFTPNAHKWVINNSPMRALQGAGTNLGVGADLGLVWYSNPNETMMLKKGYNSRYAISITDIGSINYEASSTSGSYYVSDSAMNYRAISNDPKTTFGSRIFNDYLTTGIATATASSKKFKVGLPTALHLDGDFKITPRFWVNGHALINLRQPSAGSYVNHYITTVTVTPRLMKKADWGIAFPFSFNAAMQGYLGAILYLGPVYIGSGSVFQPLAASTFNNISTYFGGTLRIKPKRQKLKDMMMM